ncbi:MAG: putative amidohydrolase [Gammaproteobacteria bacterium]|jgi:predicted amidohydrolase
MMARSITVGAAQLGPIARSDPRATVVKRMVELMQRAKSRGCELVVFPELALTTFFPRWFFNEQAELDSFFESQMPSPATQPLFDAAKTLGLGFHLGYAELVREGEKIRRFNTAVIVNSNGEIVGKYRKIHLPGHAEYEPDLPFQHLEKRYFEVGNLGFPSFEAFGANVGMCICNDRRWPESFRMLGLQGAELMLVGYNTPVHYPRAPQLDHLQDFHNHLSLQAGAYQNGSWVVGVAKAGREEGCDLIGGSCIIAPSGEIVAQAHTLDDELVTADVDLERCRELKQTIFNFALHRQPQEYGLLSQLSDSE